jgi:leucyl-tRNA synthetase
MLAPVAPHIAEELWQRLGHDTTLAYEPFPVADPRLLAVATVTLPVQVNGKVRARIEVPVDTDDAGVRTAALAAIGDELGGRTPRKVIVVPGRVVSVVV